MVLRTRLVEGEFENSMEESGRARRWLRTWLDQTSGLQLWTGDAVLLLSELVNNVLVHTSSPFTVRAHVIEARLRIEVRDQDPHPPTVQPADPLRVGGNGLRIVDRLSSRWGWGPTEDGKVVWFELDERRPV